MSDVIDTTCFVGFLLVTGLTVYLLRRPKQDRWVDLDDY